MGKKRPPDTPDPPDKPVPSDRAQKEAPSGGGAEASDTNDDAKVVGDPGGVSDYLASEISALDSMRNEDG